MDRPHLYNICTIHNNYTSYHPHYTWTWTWTRMYSMYWISPVQRGEACIYTSHRGYTYTYTISIINRHAYNNIDPSQKQPVKVNEAASTKNDRYIISYLWQDIHTCAKLYTRRALYLQLLLQYGQHESVCTHTIIDTSQLEYECTSKTSATKGI